ncbi:MAG: hypothetical protein PVJ19_23465 [Desulfobacteraceae bacterium]
MFQELTDVLTSWCLVDNDTGELPGSGRSIGSELTVSIGDVTTTKLNLMIDNAGSAPQFTGTEIYYACFR